MRHLAKYIASGALAATVILLASCSEESFNVEKFEPSVTVSGDSRVSSFAMSKRLLPVPDGVRELTIRLQPWTQGPGIELPAAIEHHGGSLACDITIDKNHEIADGRYTLSAILPGGDGLERTVDVSFEGEKLAGIHSSTYQFRLKGSGTASDPYLIGSGDDFDTFEYGLTQDGDNHGRGLCFRQTADFEAPRRSDVVDGRYYAGCDFAGTYDGGGYTIEVSYIGSSDAHDVSVGLFNALHIGASVSNLTVKANMQGLGKDSGALAGWSDDSVTVKRVTVSGAITRGGENLGGFIGRASGRLIVSDCRIFAQIEGSSHVGGLVGLKQGGPLKISGFSNLRDDYTPGLFTVNGTEYVGGVLGRADNSSVDISDVTLHHTISEEEKGLRVIYSAQGTAGGVGGYLELTSASSLSTIKILAPVTSQGNYVGGIAGKILANGDISLRNINAGSYVKGINYVGGMFGRLELHARCTFDGPNHVNRVAQSDNGYIAIDGDHCVGGVFGWLYGAPKYSTNLLVNTNVSGTTNVGGIAGELYFATIEARHYDLDRDVHVTGAENVGGLVGYAGSSTVNGRSDNGISFVTRLPRSEDFTPDFPGTVSSNLTGISMGGIIGYATESYLSGLCSGGTVSGNENVGGIVGRLSNSYRGELKYCISRNATVKCPSGTNTGGIAGWMTADFGHVKGLLNYTDIQGGRSTGGIIGLLDFSDTQYDFILDHGVNFGDISGIDNVAGCVATLRHDKSIRHTITACANYGRITNSSAGAVGGIVGHGDASKIIVMHCANHGDVAAGSGSSVVGGIAGRLGKDPGGVTVGENMEIGYCANFGNISSGNGDSHVGGILGYQEEGNDYDDRRWMTHDCYNMGEVTSDQKSDNGGIVGCVDHYAEVSRCINVGRVHYGNGVVGTRKSSCIWHHSNLYYLEGSGKGWCADSFKQSEAKTPSRFNDFDFTNVWGIDTDGTVNSGYPYLRDCPFQDMKP